MHHSRRTSVPAFTAVLAAVVLGLVGCAAADPDAPRSAEIALPPVDAVPDYQLGGAYEPETAVTLVARDRTAAPDPTRYSICYVNGFQTQPGELEIWPENALLRTADGATVVDPAWPDEVLLDTSSATQRAEILAIVQPWIVGCAASGFDAVEFDNLDSYTRSDGALTLADNLALATDLVASAHEAGLAAGQKNAAEDATELHDRAGFDFAVTETCAAYRECAAFTEVYAGHVIDIEYTDFLPRTFAEMCDDAESPPAMVLRDRELTSPEHAGYVFERCA
ncbi:endo alpha-1,4 polygalactosaminidase [Leucobacter luti]|uniref:endo alpha-1,4 polygalactosaminidase n=1 Tax=Leucobacter luti TaxID=340320 RepID=UPI001C693CB6|nr:endo alpha-1,4 polygalactosaminidase [Leucobacter luti]QYM74768.1 endo alpha-1,4 polygalactosaminidase [Leucobacter luti]